MQRWTMGETKIGIGANEIESTPVRLIKKKSKHVSE